VKCWECDIEPEETYQVQVRDRAEPVATFVRWPAMTDHVHADRPPTPEQLAEQGRIALLHIQEQWTA
jgi:hypothetical protein